MNAESGDMGFRFIHMVVVTVLFFSLALLLYYFTNLLVCGG